MSLKTYDRECEDVWPVREGAEKVRRPKPWPFKHLYATEENKGVLEPGDWVFHEKYEGVGMIVAITDDEVSILWSQEPKQDPFSSIVFPVVRRVFPQMVAQQLVSVQPMSLPKGLIFYMDYTYGNELDRKCTQGPWWSKLWWRSRRKLKCWKEKTQSVWSSLLSSLRSRSTPKLTSADPSKLTLPKNWMRDAVTPDQTKAIVDTWVNRNAAKARGPGIQGR